MSQIAFGKKLQLYEMFCKKYHFLLMESKKEYEFCFKAYSWALRHKRLLARRKVGVLEWGEPAKDQQGVWHCLPDPWQASPESS